jgi:hypothetical protein
MFQAKIALKSSRQDQHWNNGCEGNLLRPHAMS